MEAKLKEYRALRRRKELVENTKEKIRKSKDKIVNFLIPQVFLDMTKDRSEEEVLLIENEEQIPQKFQPLQTEDPSDITSEASELESLEDEPKESWQYFAIKWSIGSIIWLSLYMYFLQIQFGAVFFVVSVLIGICVNTRTTPKKRGEVSAYSVFNENCVSIDGTLKAEQFEKEIRYGAGTVR